MRLYDDLLANGCYSTQVWIGTPRQKFALIVDTGSSVTHVPCSDCQRCGSHQDPRFQPNSSSTYQLVKCNANCNCDEEGSRCTYKRQYAEGSSSIGLLGEDVISFGNVTELVPAHAVLGCKDSADGILSLGQGPVSVMDQHVDKGVISDSFSLRYGGMGVGGGAMVLGGMKSPHDMVFPHSNPSRSPYYNIELKEIYVATYPLKLNAKVFDGGYGTVLDSGTTYAYLPKDAFLALKDSIMREMRFLSTQNIKIFVLQVLEGMSIPNWSAIVDLCGKDRATGEGAEHSDDSDDVMSVEGETMSVSATEEIGDDTPKRKSTSFTSNISSNPKKLKAEDVIADAVAEMVASIKQFMTKSDQF